MYFENSIIFFSKQPMWFVTTSI